MNTDALIEIATGRFPEGVTASHCYRGDATLILQADSLLAVAEFLRDDPAFRMNMLVDLTAVDYSVFGRSHGLAFFASSGVAVRPAAQIPDEDPWPGPPSKARFAVVYHFYSMSYKHRLRLAVPVEEEVAEVDSLVPLWAGANWLEREVWDMYGIKFRGHPDLRRILMYDGFEGFPLRKDYPVNKRQPLIGPLN